MRRSDWGSSRLDPFRGRGVKIPSRFASKHLFTSLRGRGVPVRGSSWGLFCSLFAIRNKLRFKILKSLQDGPKTPKRAQKDPQWTPKLDPCGPTTVEQTHSDTRRLMLTDKGRLKADEHDYLRETLVLLRLYSDQIVSFMPRRIRVALKTLFEDLVGTCCTILGRCCGTCRAQAKPNFVPKSA